MATSVRLVLHSVAGVVLGVVSVLGAGLLMAWPPTADVMTAVMVDVRPRSGIWRLLRGSLGYIAVPALLVLGGVALTAAWRRDRVRALTFSVCVLVSNLLVQGVKHGQLPSPAGLNPLSGHAGLACGLALSWYAVLGDRSDGPGSRRGRGAVLTVAAGTGAAVVLTGWHSLAQVLCPLGLAAGCALIGRAAVGSRRPVPGAWGSAPSAARAAVSAGATGAVLRALAVALGLAAVAVLPRLVAHPLLAAAACVTAVVAATASAMCLVGGSRPELALPGPGRVRGN